MPFFFLYPEKYNSRFGFVQFSKPVQVGVKIRKIGYCKRHVRYRQKINRDDEFIQFCKNRGVKLTGLAYDIVRGNHEQGRKAFMQFDHPECKYDETEIIRSWEMLLSEYAPHVHGRLSPDYKKLFELRTSAGYPWSQYHKNKREACADEDLVCYLDKFVKSRDYIPAFASNTIKREPKKDITDPRVINALSMELTGKGNYLFYDMNEQIHAAGRKHKISSTVGMSKFRLGWNRLYEYLSVFPNAMECDFKKFDKSIDSFMMDLVMNFRFRLFLKPEMKGLMEHLTVFYQHVKHTIVVLENGDILQKSSGNPSGQTNTITDNNIVNALRWMYAWNMLAPDKVYKNYGAWIKHVRLAVCGDDSLITVSDEVKGWFNPTTINALFNSMNWGTKFSSETFKKLIDCEYCSLGFKRFKKYIVPVSIKRDKILCNMAYNTPKVGIEYSYIRACNIRMDVFFNDELYELFDSYARYLQKEKWDEIINGSVGIDDLRNVYKSRMEILDLYCLDDDGDHTYLDESYGSLGFLS